MLGDRLACPANSRGEIHSFMCYLYIIKNNKCKYYVGITGLSPETRLLRHNKGDVYSTKFGCPWELIYFEEYVNMFEARKREKQIKSWHGGNAFKELLLNAAGSSNGRTAASGAVNLGPNPSPAALNKRTKGSSNLHRQ